MVSLQSSSARARSRLSAAGIACVAAVTLGTTAASTAPALPAAMTASRGSVSTLFAGSLAAYMEASIGPAFQRADGYALEGFTGGSTELANEIRGGVRRGDVFVSASATADRSLQGAANGAWVSWYATFVASPLVLAYNPQSSVGSELRRGVPWYRVLTRSGIRVGRTDPKLDPKGILTIEAIAAASKRLHYPALAHAQPSFEVFPEASLVGRLQSGQLDAGFFYAVEAKTARLTSVPLTPVYKYANYTVTILNRAPNVSGAVALLRYLLSSARSNSLQRNGLNPLTPQLSGARSAVPPALRSLLGAR
jgi:molybdate/tungstate transport system substrate-binding protein